MIRRATLCNKLYGRSLPIWTSLNTFQSSPAIMSRAPEKWSILSAFPACATRSAHSSGRALYSFPWTADRPLKVGTVYRLKKNRVRFRGKLIGALLTRSRALLALIRTAPRLFMLGTIMTGPSLFLEDNYQRRINLVN